MGAVSDGARTHRVTRRALARAAPSVPNGGDGAGELGGGADKKNPAARAGLFQSLIQHERRIRN
jgi:hypothetical protein